MVPSIARQSVILKCNMQRSILTGNYEIPDEIRPLALAALIKESGPGGPDSKTANVSAEKIEYLRQMLLDYMPKEEYDLQMKELLTWGMGEERLFQV